VPASAARRGHATGLTVRGKGYTPRCAAELPSRRGALSGPGQGISLPMPHCVPTVCARPSGVTGGFIREEHPASRPRRGPQVKVRRRWPASSRYKATRLASTGSGSRLPTDRLSRPARRTTARPRPRTVARQCSGPPTARRSSRLTADPHVSSLPGAAKADPEPTNAAAASGFPGGSRVRPKLPMTDVQCPRTWSHFIQNLRCRYDKIRLRSCGLPRVVELKLCCDELRSSTAGNVRWWSEQNRVSR